MSTFAPAPGAAPLHRMVRAQAELEFKLLLRNGEQFLLTLVVPLLLLLVGASVDLGSVTAASGRRIDAVVPGVLALAVLSTAFTGQAIATGFERRYGVLKRLGATPLPRGGLLAGKALAVLAIEVLQVALVSGLGLALGWRPQGNPLAVLVLLAVATAAFTGLALLMAGSLRAEATLAGANLVWLLLLLGGGVIAPLSRYPEAARPFLELLPLAALSEGLRAVLAHGSGLPWSHVLVLAAWALVAGGAAAATFRWE